MKALYFDNLPSTDNAFQMDVNNINGNPGTFGTLGNLVNTNPDYFWSSWGCSEGLTACAISTLTSLSITDGMSTYSATVESFVGGRPCRPIAR